jgi:DNA-binding XRE family transcriptional regulator
MRNGLYMFRHSKRLSQAEMADKIGCNRATYAAIESGKRDGRMTFWNALKKAFGVSDSDIGGLMKVDEEQTQNDR